MSDQNLDNPIPSDGCICASFWTVRRAHKKDCLLNQDKAKPPNSGELERWMESHGFKLENGTWWGGTPIDPVFPIQAEFWFTICQKVEREARIDELHRWPRYKVGGWAVGGSDVDNYLRRRLAQLTVPQDTTKQEEET